MTDAVRLLVARGSELHELREQAARDGLRSLRVSGAEKVVLGLTTIDEVLRAAPRSGTKPTRCSLSPACGRGLG